MNDTTEDLLYALMRGSDLPELPAWHRNAACRDADLSTFFPGQGSRSTEARAICAACPMSAQCLSWALGQPGDLLGIWAGTTQQDRRELRRERRAA